MTQVEQERDPRPFSPNSIHMVRTVQTLTMQLSQMADQKASILMGATFVVFTVAIGQASHNQLPLALGVLAFFAFVSAVLAVSAVLPRVSPHTAPKDGNILFFGTFSQLPEEEFIGRVKALCGKMKICSRRCSAMFIRTG